MTREKLIIKMIEIYEDGQGSAIDRMGSALRLADAEIAPTPLARGVSNEWLQGIVSGNPIPRDMQGRLASELLALRHDNADLIADLDTAKCNTGKACADLAALAATEPKEPQT